MRALAIVFLVQGLVRLAEMPLPLLAPQLIEPGWATGHGLVGEPEALLPERAQAMLAARPGADARFRARLEEPGVRVRHQALTLAIDLPVVAIFLGLGLALWRSVRLVPGAVEAGLWWLGVAGWACLYAALAFPVLDGLRTVLILDGVIPTPHLLWYDPATGSDTYLLLLIAGGILAAVWTIGAGLRARADMAEIV